MAQCQLHFKTSQATKLTMQMYCTTLDSIKVLDRHYSALEMCYATFVAPLVVVQCGHLAAHTVLYFDEYKHCGEIL